MPDKNSAVDEFLANQGGEGNDNLPKEDANPFANLNVEQTEQPPTPTGEDGGDKGNKKPEGEGESHVPFHQNPKVQKFIAKEVERLTRHLTPKQAEEVRDKVSNEPDLVQAFTTIIGNDTPEKVAALQALGRTIDTLKADAKSAKDLLESERKAERQAVDELNNGLSSIEDSFDNVDLTSNTPTARKAKSEFLEFVMRVAPKNADGEIVAYPDFYETFVLFQDFKKKAPTANNRAKDLASRSMQRSGDASAPQVPADTSWKGVDKFFSSLKG